MVEEEESTQDGAENIFNTYTSGESEPRNIIVILPSDSVKIGIEFLNLPHPKTGVLTRYAISRQGRNELYEVQKCKPRTGSWLLGAPDDRVIEDGSVFIITPIDATFLVLPSLESAAAGERFCTLEDAITRGENGGLLRCLLRVESLLKGVSEICESRQVETEKYFKISEEKALLWLRKKVDAAKSVIESDERFRFLASKGSFSSSYKKSSEIPIDDGSVTRAALGFVGEKLNKDWMSRCSKCCGMEVDFEPAKAAKLIAPTKGTKREIWEVSSSGFHRPQVAAASSSPAPPQAKKQKQEPDRKSLAESRAESKKKKDLEKGKGSKQVTNFFSPIKTLDADDEEIKEEKKEEEGHH